MSEINNKKDNNDMRNSNHYEVKFDLSISLKLQVIHDCIFIYIPEPFIVNNKK